MRLCLHYSNNKSYHETRAHGHTQLLLRRVFTLCKILVQYWTATAHWAQLPQRYRSELQQQCINKGFNKDILTIITATSSSSPFPTLIVYADGLIDKVISCEHDCGHLHEQRNYDAHLNLEFNLTVQSINQTSSCKYSFVVSLFLEQQLNNIIIRLLPTTNNKKGKRKIGGMKVELIVNHLRLVIYLRLRRFY